MEQTMNITDKIRAVAVWAGYRYSATVRKGEIFSKKGDSVIVGIWPILTDLNVLHVLAMRVLDELRAYKKSINAHFDIKAELAIMSACASKPNADGQYIALFNAVYQGIELLNQLKEK